MGTVTINTNLGPVYYLLGDKAHIFKFQNAEIIILPPSEAVHRMYSLKFILTLKCTRSSNASKTINRQEQSQVLKI